MREGDTRGTEETGEMVVVTVVRKQAGKGKGRGGWRPGSAIAATTMIGSERAGATLVTGTDATVVRRSMTME